MSCNSTMRFVRGCQNLMTICRQAIEGGYCLIVEDDYPTARMIANFIRFNGKESRIVESAEDALTILHEDSKHIINVVIDHHLAGGGDGEEIVQEIERNHKGVPYVFHTGDAGAGKRVSEKYPNANVIMKGDSICKLIESLGFSAAG